MNTNQKTQSTQQPAHPNSTELSDLELDKVNGGIIAILIGKSSTSMQSVAPSFAAQGPQNSGPSLSDALNSTPTLPDATGPKPKNSTFDTLTGNPLVR